MRYLSKKLFFVLLLFCSLSAFAKERYSVRVLPDGNMYFFMPYKLKGSSGTVLQYDMTQLSYSDSVAINMTLTSPMGRVKSIRLFTGEENYSTTQYELFFQERAGSRFNTRIHIDCPLSKFKQLFSGSVPLTIELMMEDGKHYAFTYKTKTWQKEVGFVSEVQEMIAYSNSRQ